MGSKTIRAVLEDVYFNPKSPASYAGINAILREAKKQLPLIKLADVENFLASTDAYTLHRPVKKRYPRNPMTAAGIDVKWQADLIDWPNVAQFNNGVKYLLVCIDVFSRFAYVRPMRNKNADTVRKAFSTILAKGRKPWILYTDKGKEFLGSFAKYLVEQGIQHVHAASPDVKCAIVERYNRTLRTRLAKYFTRNNTRKYTDILQAFVTAINNSHHRTLGMAPSQVTNELEIQAPTLKARKKFSVGDRVRIALDKGVFEKGYSQNFSSEIYEVQKVLANRRPIAYKLKGRSEVFYNEELVRVLSTEPRRNLRSRIKRHG